jgi:hypothetical protein
MFKLHMLLLMPMMITDILLMKIEEAQLTTRIVMVTTPITATLV